MGVLGLLALLFRGLHHHPSMWHILQCMQQGPEMNKTHTCWLPWGETERTGLSWEELKEALWGTLWAMMLLFLNGVWAVFPLGFSLQVD